MEFTDFERLASVEAQLADLTETVERQQQIIDMLLTWQQDQAAPSLQD